MAYDGDTVRAARMRRGLTQQELGQVTGSSTRAVQRWESSGVPDTSPYLHDVAEFLGDELDAGGDGAPAATGSAADHPGTLQELSHGALWALAAAVSAEQQRRFFALADERVAGHGAPPVLPGTQLAYPAHLLGEQAQTGQARAGD